MLSRNTDSENASTEQKHLVCISTVIQFYQHFVTEILQHYVCYAILFRGIFGITEPA